VADDDGQITEVPGPDGPSKKGLWDRYRDAATWVKVGIPVAVAIVAVLVGSRIADAVGDDESTATAETTTTTTTASTNDSHTLILLAIASDLATDETADTTTTTAVETTTTAEEPTTTEAPTTTAASTTTAAPTTAATTAPPTAPPTAATSAPVAPTTAKPATPTTAAPAPTTSPPTSTPATSRPTTPSSISRPTLTSTSGPTTPTSAVPLPPGQVADSADAFQAAWNAAAPAAGVPEIGSWTDEEIAGHPALEADLGKNLRVVLLTDGEDGPVSEAVLAWLPTVLPSQEAEQNAAYQAAFGVLMQSVDEGVTDEQQAEVAGALGLSPSAPPFPEGTTASAPQGERQYDLRALVPEGRRGVYTLIGATSSG